MRSAPAPSLSPLRRPLLDSTDGQLYATSFGPLREGQDARLLLQPGRGIDLRPGMEVDYRGPSRRYRLRLEAFLPERGATRRRRTAPVTRSNRIAVRVLSIGPDDPPSVGPSASRRAPYSSLGSASLLEPEELVPCTVCSGSGAVEIPGVCPECNGHAHGCPDCEGTGRLDWSDCSACHGRGRVPRGR